MNRWTRKIRWIVALSTMLLSIDEFRQEFDAYLDLMEQRYRRLSESANLLGVWKAARDLLGERYWSKFLFDGKADMVCYDAD